MRIKFILLISILYFNFTGLSKSGILDYTITLSVKSTPIKTILKKIEDVGHVQFSYNPNIIDENKLVSLNIKQKSIRFGLSLIFDKSIRFKEVGQHIVLLKNELKKDIRARKQVQEFYVFTGKITDRLTDKPIEGASIYDVDSRHAVLTNKNGYYKLTVPVEEQTRSLYFSKKGYKKVVIVVDASKTLNLKNNISLFPEQVDIEKIVRNEPVKVPQTFQEKAVSGIMISPETYQHSENLEDIEETRLFQVSVVPSLGIGSNLSTNGLIVNKFSLNIIGGYAKGVDGFELGGIFNVDKENVNGIQIAGVTNLIGGNVNGLQIAGVTNIVQGNVNGFQVSGVVSVTKQNLDGFQISGISSIIRGGFNGFQVGGVTNIVYENSTGFQLAGIYNEVKDTLIGSQIAGVTNRAVLGNTTVQIAGISNVNNINSGVQISVILNRTKINNGFQMGLINLSKQSNGIALGLINFVKEGYHKTEISTNELTHLNITFKSGVKRLYNTYSYGIRFDKKPLHSIGLGLGSYFTMSERINLNTDLSLHLLLKDKKNYSYLFKLSPTFDYKLTNWITVFGGPSVNMNITYLSKAVDGIIKPNTPIFNSYDSAGSNITTWFGGNIGFRF